jgi:hypothetical protein
MKTSKLLHSGTIAVVALLSLTTVKGVDSTNLLERARESYRKGVAAYQASKWNEAVAHFSDSYAAIPKAETAMFLSSSYMEQDNARKALEFATKALTTRPVLAGDYKIAAEKTKLWAEQTLDTGSRIEGKADGLDNPTVSNVSKPTKIKPRKNLPHF